MSNVIEVPLHVIHDLEEIREEGKYNMFDSNGVLNEMNENPEMTKSLLWLINIDEDCITLNKKRYSAALKELGEVLSIAERLKADH